MSWFWGIAECCWWKKIARVPVRWERRSPVYLGHSYNTWVTLSHLSSHNRHSFIPSLPSLQPPLTDIIDTCTVLLWSSDFSNVWTLTETIIATKRWPRSNRGIATGRMNILQRMYPTREVLHKSCLCGALFCYNPQRSYPRLKLKNGFCYQVQMSSVRDFSDIEW